MTRQNLLGSLIISVALWGALAASSNAQCTGDCNGNTEVTVEEVITGVNIALENTPLSACTAFDADQSGMVTVNEIVAAVSNALNGCALKPTPTPSAGVCGDRVVNFDQGETCDDGNTLDGDACPADCRIRACTASGTELPVDVQFTAPAGVDLAGITVFVRYPDGVVRIPGSANDNAVLNSIMNLPDNGFSTPNDLDYALRVVIFTPDSSAIAPGRLFTIQFDTCAGAATPTASDFSCNVESGADTNNGVVNGVTCAVVLP